ncbi:MAG: hypothetical protein ILA34_04135 [Bacteroidaceae bacterium]|nr:hypothetical protein [Bacteroidaceae bacterium]
MSVNPLRMWLLACAMAVGMVCQAVVLRDGKVRFTFPDGIPVVMADSLRHLYVVQDDTVSFVMLHVAFPDSVRLSRSACMQARDDAWLKDVLQGAEVTGREEGRGERYDLLTSYVFPRHKKNAYMRIYRYLEDSEVTLLLVQQSHEDWTLARRVAHTYRHALSWQMRVGLLVLLVFFVYGMGVGWLLVREHDAWRELLCGVLILVSSVVLTVALLLCFIDEWNSWAYPHWMLNYGVFVLLGSVAVYIVCAWYLVRHDGETLAQIGSDIGENVGDYVRSLFGWNNHSSH